MRTVTHYAQNFVYTDTWFRRPTPLVAYTTNCTLPFFICVATASRDGIVFNTVRLWVCLSVNTITVVPSRKHHESKISSKARTSSKMAAFRYKYNEIFVRRRSIRTIQECRITTIISQYARSNKTVLSRIVNTLVSVMSCKSDGRVFQRPDRSSGNHVRQTWCVFSAVCQPCHTI